VFVSRHHLTSFLSSARPALPFAAGHAMPYYVPEGTLKYALLFGVIYNLAFYFSGYVFPSFNKLKAFEKSVWGSSCNSLILSIWIPYLACTCGLENGGKFLSYDYPLTWKNDDIILIGKIMMGYFVADVAPCLYYTTGWGKDWYVFALHHISGGLYIRTCLYHGLGHGSILAMTMTEPTNFFNMLRFFFSKIKDKDGNSISKRFPALNLMNGVLFALGFVVFRIYGFTHIGWWMLYMNAKELYTLPLGFQVSVHFSFMVGISMQWYWMFKIAVGLYDLLTGKKSAGKKQE